MGQTLCQESEYRLSSQQGCSAHRASHGLGLHDKLRSQQILARRWGEEGWEGKASVDGASWTGMDLALKRKLDSPCGHFKHMNPRGWLWEGQGGEARMAAALAGNGEPTKLV